MIVVVWEFGDEDGYQGDLIVMGTEVRGQRLARA